MRFNAKHILPFFLWAFSTSFLFEDILMRIFPSIIEPQLQQHFSIDATQLGLFSSGFMLSYGLMQIPAGLLIDKFGLRRTLPIGTLLICLAVVILPLTSSYAIALVMRFVMGMGSAFAFIGCMQVIYRFFALHKRPMMVGLTVMVGAFAGVFCNTALLWIAQHSWHAMLTVLSISAGVLTIILWQLLKHVPEDPQKNQHPSVLHSLKAVGRNLQTWEIALLCGLVYLPYAMFNDMWGIPFLQVFDHLSKVHASWIISSVWIGWMVGGPFLGWLAMYQKSLLKPIQWMIVLQVILLGLFLLMHHLPLWLLLLMGGLLGLGGASMNLCYLLGQQANRQHGVSLSTGVINTVVTLCVLIYLPFMGFILNLNAGSRGDNVLQLPIHNYALAFSSLLIILCIGLLLSYGFQRAHKAITILQRKPRSQLA